MLTVENFTIQGNTYQIKDQLRNLGCYFDKDSQKYKCDKHTIESVEKFLKEVNEHTEKVVRTAWDKACDRFGITVCSKQHPLYPQILESFKEFKQSP